MAYVRLEDSALNHPKVARLSAHAFRLWVWGLCHAQMHLTDGYLAARLLPNRRQSRPNVAAAELCEAHLWEPVEGGYQIHDYLQYNDSKEVVEARKQKARERMQERRSGADRRLDPPAPLSQSSDVVRANITRTTREAPLPLVSISSSERKEEREEKTPEARAARLLQELYPTWYAKYRHGARLRLGGNSLEFRDAVSLCATWEDARIEKLARVFLTTDDDWISNTDRGFRIFAVKASWCDDRLKQAERAQGAA